MDCNLCGNFTHRHDSLCAFCATTISAICEHQGSLVADLTITIDPKGYVKVLPVKKEVRSASSQY